MIPSTWHLGRLINDRPAGFVSRAVARAHAVCVRFLASRRGFVAYDELDLIRSGTTPPPP